MLRDALRRFVESYPNVARWFGDRLDLQIPAFAASLLTHLLLLASLAMVGYAAHSEYAQEFRTEVVRTSLEDFATFDTTALAETEEPTILAPVAGSFAPTASPLLLETAQRPPKAMPALPQTEVALASGIVLPRAVRLDTAVSIKGSGAEHVGGAEGAVDRIAVEILRQLEKGHTLVIWAFDASGSLLAERQRLAKHIDGVYAHIAAADTEKFAQGGGLLTAVVAFGSDRKLMTPEPTGDRQVILSAIESVPLDTTGVETTFQTVIDIARKWGKFRKDGEPYRTMCIVVTDEVGDDEDKLEEAIAAASSAHMPIYVLGSPALFGRAEGYMDYTDPRTKQTFRHIPVRQGPESVMIEGIRLPFWFDGPQYEFLDSGFGPYALSRLAGATGGIYFITRMGSNRVTFDPDGMREYQPDWVSRDQYLKAIARHPIRQAVVAAAQICQQDLPHQPPLTFPAAESPEFKQAMSRNQERAARVEYTVNMALEPITAVVKKRDHEPSRRWQAHYDLIRGRLLAMKLRCHEYNAACARMKKDPLKFSKPNSNAWRLVPSDEIQSPKGEAVAKEAKALLRRVVTDHPGTPWALMAQRELKDPLGFKWVETTVPPPAKAKDSGGNAAKKKAKKPEEKPKPAEKPKL
ncbi:MAG: VWA domain-containing protein [Isosphaeraceae bacterium]|nr:VWA domain-containing protein [Isosphaeraceae bacterium]